MDCLFLSKEIKNDYWADCLKTPEWAKVERFDEKSPLTDLFSTLKRTAKGYVKAKVYVHPVFATRRTIGKALYRLAEAVLPSPLNS